MHSSSGAVSETSVSSVANALSQIAVRRVASCAVTENSPDVLAVEEPLEIRLGLPDKKHRAISITMRTPGEDAELATGFLFTEGIIKSPDQIRQVRHCGLKLGRTKDVVDRAAALSSNTIRVDLNDASGIDFEKLQRHFYTTSSCGVCGKSSIDALKTGAKPLADSRTVIESEIIPTLPEKLRASQSMFDQTGGIHASALFTVDGQLELVREDVGRHNALDKVIGAKFLSDDLPLSDRVLLVSGRASFELIQKALMAGIPILVAVGAPSSLAVELAREFGMTVVGFARGDSFNVYTGESRVV